MSQHENRYEYIKLPTIRLNCSIVNPSLSGLNTANVRNYVWVVSSTNNNNDIFVILSPSIFSDEASIKSRRTPESV